MKKHIAVDLNDEQIATIKRRRRLDKKSLKKEDKKYVDDGKWKCEKSPTGSHHWVSEEIGYSHPMVYYKHTCKYCHKIKKSAQMVG